MNFSAIPTAIRHPREELVHEQHAFDTAIAKFEAVQADSNIVKADGDSNELEALGRWSPETKPMIYIAAPFFNGAQKVIVRCIERAITWAGYSYYSPETDSGSLDLSPEMRGNSTFWKQVFNNNVQAIKDSILMIAVLDYALPEGQELRVCDTRNGYDTVRRVEIPDSGVVWEMGDAYQRVDIVGYRELEPTTMNLMLAKTVTGMVYGLDNLADFLHTSEPACVRFDYTQLHTYEGKII